MKILVLNCGSSSLKYQLLDMENEKVLAKGNYERIGEGVSFITHKVEENKYVIEKPVDNHRQAIEFALSQLKDTEYKVINDLKEINAIGHRVVHGGEKFNSSVIINKEVISEIENCTTLAPLHNPAALIGIEACMDVIPNIPMVAVFDTAFHQTIPKENYIYSIPYKYYEKHKIRKYGFHGTSHKYVTNKVAEIIRKPIEELKIVSCHLGQGASLCAVKEGKSVDTSMGLTPLAGIPMCARCGDIDPSILTFLMKKENLSVEELEKILNKESGVYGISGISQDFRDIEKEASSGNKQAMLAINNYSNLVAQYILRYSVSLEGLDVIVFTAGIGENQINIRKKICDNLKFFGVEIDEDRNNIRGEETLISSDKSKVKVYIIPTNEELMIAKETMNLIG